MSESLTVTEVAKLENFELVIHDGLKSFVDVGRALMEIRDGRLYRETHMNFESYCQEKWGMSRQRAHQFIDSSAVVESLSTIADVTPPQNESQARPLTRLEPSDQVVVWQEAVDTAPDGKVTAAHVQSVVDRHLESNDDTVVEADENPKASGSQRAKAAAARAGKLRNAAQESRDWFAAAIEKVCDGGVYTMESIPKAIGHCKQDCGWFVRMCDVSPLVTVHRTQGAKCLIQYSFVRNDSTDAQGRIRKLAQRIADDPNVGAKSGKAALEILSLLGG